MYIQEACYRDFQGNVPKRLQGERELVRRVGDERVEGVPKPRLADQLERSPAHPQKHVDFHGAIMNANEIFNALLELKMPCKLNGEVVERLRSTNLA